MTSRIAMAKSNGPSADPCLTPAEHLSHSPLRRHIGLMQPSENSTMPRIGLREGFEKTSRMIVVREMQLKAFFASSATAYGSVCRCDLHIFTAATALPPTPNWCLETHCSTSECVSRRMATMLASFVSADSGQIGRMPPSGFVRGQMFAARTRALK